VEHRDGQWYISTNAGGLLNMKLVTCAAGPDCAASWKPVAGPKGDVLFDGGASRPLDGVMPLKSHLVVFGREGGIPRVWVAGLKGQKVQSFERIEFDEDAYDVGGAGNYEYVVGGGLWSAQERDRAGTGSQLTPSSLVLASHAGTTPTP
jgi:oligopeptidase B